MTGREGLDHLLEQREKALGFKAGRTTFPSIRQPAVRPSTLAQLPAGPPCQAMSRQRDAVMKQLANGRRHAAVLGPVLQLVRLGQQGHQGLGEALTDVRRDFVSRVSDDRAGGEAEASLEWDRAVRGALAKVFPGGILLAADRCCSCFIADLRAALNDHRLFTPRGQLSERKILRYLILRAQYKGSRLVQESQRQIAEAVDVNQPTVTRVIKRLMKLGWLTRHNRSSKIEADGYLLHLPEAFKKLSTRLPTAAGPLVDTTMNAFVHRLFGPRGLGPGPAETFAALPEWRIPFGRGALVRKTPLLPSTPGLVNPWQGTRQIPRPTPGTGMTVAGLIERTGKSRPTVQRHLKRLSERGMAFHERGRWWRYRFDPDVIADRDEIPHTSLVKVARHLAERRSYFQALIDSAPDQLPSRVIRNIRGGRWCVYVDVTSGEVLWRDPEPLK